MKRFDIAKALGVGLDVVFDLLAACARQASRPTVTAVKRAVILPEDPAARAYALRHEHHRSLVQIARELGCGTYDVGELLTAHNKRVVADAVDRAKVAGLGPPSTDANDAREHARASAVLEKARKLILEGVDTVDIAARLDVNRRLVSDLSGVQGEALGGCRGVPCGVRARPRSAEDEAGGVAWLG